MYQLKILLACFADIRKVGGGATTARILAKKLYQKGYSISILSKVNSQQFRESPEIIDGIEVSFHKIIPDIFWRIPLVTLEKKIANFLKRNIKKPNVFITLSPYYVNAARAIWPTTRIIFIFPCLLSECMRFIPEYFGKIPFRFLNTALLKNSEKNALFNSDKVLIPSQAILQQVENFCGKCNSKFLINPLGVNDLKHNISETKEDARKRFKTPASATIVLTVGTLDKNKNITMILKSFADSLQKNTTKNLYFWIAGIGPLEQELKHQVTTLRITDNVRFLGSQTEMQNVYNATDLYVHSAYYEAFGYVYLEAMVSGLPVIGPRNTPGKFTSSLQEIIENGKEGYLYSLEEPEELTNYIMDLSNNEVKRKSMGILARQRVLSNFTWDDYLENLEKLL